LCGIGHELFNLVLNLVSDKAEYFFFLVDQSIGGIWIYDIPVQNSEGEGEYRVSFLGCVTDGDPWPNGSFNDSATLFVFWPEMSIPASFVTSLARGLDALRSTPTLTTSNRSPVSFRRKPSAIRLRVAFPVERNRTFGLCLVISPHFFDPNWPRFRNPTV
jgi:hypothetical protein